MWQVWLILQIEPSSKINSKNSEIALLENHVYNLNIGICYAWYCNFKIMIWLYYCESGTKIYMDNAQVTIHDLSKLYSHGQAF